MRELTVAEIRAWIADPTADVEAHDAVALALLEDVTFGDLKRMTDLTDEEMANAVPSDLEAVRERCKEVNRSFFALRERLAMAGEKALVGKSS